MTTRDTNTIGSNNEEAMKEALRNSGLVAECVRTGATFDNADLKYRLHNETIWRSLQVKTRSFVPYKDIQNKYPADMLIVILHPKKQYMWIMLAKQAIDSYKSCRYNNLDSIVAALKHYLPLSCPFSEQLSATHCKEQNMVKALMKLCVQHKWTFTFNDTVTVVDGMFNGQRAQLKYTTTRGNDHHRYRVHTFKTVDDKAVPYASTDFDVLIVMIGTCTERIYEIPMHALIQHGIVSTEHQQGITSIHLRNPMDEAYAARNKFWKYILPPQPTPILTKLQTICDKCGKCVSTTNLSRHYKKYCH
jgi:hypothetical protein